MGNNYKRIVYAGLQIREEEFLKAMGFEHYDAWSDYADKNKLNLDGHQKLVGHFGEIYTDDDYICVGMILDASGENESEPAHVDLLVQFEAVKNSVNEVLRKLKICIGDVKLYATTLCY